MSRKLPLIRDNGEHGVSIEPVEKRRHLRHSIKQPCTACLEDGVHIGAVVDMSVSGAVSRSAGFRLLNRPLPANPPL